MTSLKWLKLPPCGDSIDDVSLPALKDDRRSNDISRMQSKVIKELINNNNNMK